MRKFFIYFFAMILFTGVCYASEIENDFETEVFFHRVKEVELPIVMYHLVTENSRYIGKYGITPADFEKDLKYLKDNEYNTVVMQDLIDFVNRGKKLPKNPIMITIDDGNSSDFYYVLPLLKKYKMKAVIAILGEPSDECTVYAERNPDGRYPHLSWSQIEALHKSGHVEIQNHSYSLHTPPTGSGKRGNESIEAYHARLYKDLQKLQEACAAHLNYVPTTFVYPLGVIGVNSKAVLENLGMSGSISCQEGMNTIRQGDKDCLFKLRRSNRPSSRSIEDILQKLKG